MPLRSIMQLASLNRARIPQPLTSRDILAVKISSRAIDTDRVVGAGLHAMYPRESMQASSNCQAFKPNWRLNSA